jgi:hypothetical protein
MNYPKQGYISNFNRTYSSTVEKGPEKCREIQMTITQDIRQTDDDRKMK